MTILRCRQSHRRHCKTNNQVWSLFPMKLKRRLSTKIRSTGKTGSSSEMNIMSSCMTSRWTGTRAIWFPRTIWPRTMIFSWLINLAPRSMRKTPTSLTLSMSRYPFQLSKLRTLSFVSSNSLAPSTWRSSNVPTTNRLSLSIWTSLRPIWTRTSSVRDG